MRVRLALAIVFVLALAAQVAGQGSTFPGLPTGCTTGQVPEYSTVTNRWSCATPSGGGITCADTGVVFADGANAPACDATGFSYNKTTDTLSTAAVASKANADGCFGWLCRKTVTLLDAQIKALPTTPVEILAAPGAGKALLIISGTIRLDTAAGAYSNVGSATGGLTGIFPEGFGPTQENFADSFASAAVGNYFILNARSHEVFVTGDADVTAGIAAPGQPKSAAAGAVEGNLRLIVDNYDSLYITPLGNFGGGNAANTLTFTLYYIVTDVP